MPKPWGAHQWYHCRFRGAVLVREGNDQTWGKTEGPQWNSNRP
jgi:hypothetical protein